MGYATTDVNFPSGEKITPNHFSIVLQPESWFKYITAMTVLDNIQNKT